MRAPLAQKNGSHLINGARQSIDLALVCPVGDASVQRAADNLSCPVGQIIEVVGPTDGLLKNDHPRQD